MPEGKTKGDMIKDTVVFILLLPVACIVIPIMSIVMPIVMGIGKRMGVVERPQRRP
jgi:hypothetical protein